MNKIRQIYLDNFIQRFDKDGIIQYLSNTDFENFQKEEYIFMNSINIEIHSFLYFYDNYKKDKLIIFLPGIGPGHTAYIREIELLAEKGYLVLTLDYCGCGESKGKTLFSVNEPTRDVHDLILELTNKNIKRINELNDYEITIIGHSLGAYTALNTINLHKSIKKAVIISGFINITKEFMGMSHIHLPLLFKTITKYEEEVNKEYNHLDNINYLKETNDKILFIHSKDDSMVPYKSSTGYIIKHIKNDNLSFMLFDHRKHNPNYTDSAIQYMNETFGTYYKMLKEQQFKTKEEQIIYMKSKDLLIMTEQDELVFKKIFELIEN